MKCYPEIKEKEEMRKIIGRYGLTGKQQVRFVFFLFFLRLGTGARFVGFTPGMDVVDVLPAPPQFPTAMLRI